MTFRIYILCSLFCSILCSNCDYKGTTYRQEETWVAEDRCNICTCRSDGTISCETKQCSPVKCHDNGRDYNIGETFLSSDGCNECVCTVNGAACTRISCGGAGVEYTHIPRCSYDGRIYTVGDAFMSVDGCNRCICTEKQVEICTKMYCAPSTLKPQETTKEPKCTYNGKIYSYLAQFNSSDGCNTCTCTANEQVACTERACLPPTTKVETTLLVSTTPQTSSSITKVSTTPMPTCAYNGRIYNTGDQFKADDGCNSCTCGGNERVICTLMACPPKTTKMLTSLKSSTPVKTTVILGTKNVVSSLPMTLSSETSQTTVPASTTMHVETTTIHKCNYNGRVYDYGMSFKDDDGCNICICGKNEIICSLMKCPTSTTKIPTTVPIKTTLLPSNASMIQVTPPKRCNYNGHDYDVGVSFKADDGCNSCSCTEQGVIGCTLMLCPPTTVEANNISSTVVSKMVTCIYNGQVYNVGESFKNTDGCNTCRCTEDGGIACTKMFCISTTKLLSTQPITQAIATKTQPTRKCDYNGHIYFVEDTFKATDGCNTCRCTGEQEIACTKIYCPPTSIKNVITDVTTPTIETTYSSGPITTINHLKVTMNK